MRLLLPLFAFLLLAASPLAAQKVMQIERYGSPQTKKILIGDFIEYKIEGEDFFRTGYIEDFKVEDNLIQMGDFYLNIEEIAALRFTRRWAKAGGAGLMIFGASWSGFALLGYATDGDPNTSYRTLDAIVSLTSVGLGYGISRLFRYKVVRFNDRRWLRLLDLSFKQDGRQTMPNPNRP
ncbi:MAG: hypothetical protein GVY26_11755 [Bacteroidetes bacterium]|jgi:hypothetical protein|nr:hypothetical protein [Bacteroidota bacterium]